MKEVLLESKNVFFSYPHSQAVLNGVDLTIHKGELITLLGPNGSGKSTFMNCLMGLLKPQQGSILVNRTNINYMNARAISRKIAYVAQNPEVTFSHTVRNYIAMGRTPYLKIYEKPSSDDYNLVDEAIERLGIEKLADKQYTQISGGERQLVNVCRAIVQQPELIIFDEPTSALDYGNQIKVLRLIKELSSEGYSILISTHNPDHPILLDGTVCVLSRGGKMRTGTVEDIMTEDYLDEIYQTQLHVKYVDEAQRMICFSGKL